MTPIHRVFLVDDHEPWRRRMIAALERNPEWRVAGEAADGLTAVAMAEALGPDLILLDISLPGLDGIQAARQILEQNPRSRILFVSEQHAREIVEAALDTGALGYLVKSDAGMELLPAMSAVVEGHHFVSASLAADHFGICRHVAAFCAGEAQLIDEYVRFAEGALKAGNVLFVSVVESRLEAIRQALQARGVDVDRAVQEGRYCAGSAEAALSDWMVDGVPDKGRIRALAATAMTDIAAASAGQQRRVSALGECAAVLAKSGNTEAAARAEELWDEVVRRYNIDAFCGYCAEDITRDDDDPMFRRICAAHSAVHVRSASTRT